MKKLFIVPLLLLVFAGCEKDDDNQRALMVNGVEWATTNVDDPFTFAARPDMYTKFYQWNKNTGWPATGNVKDWPETEITDLEWKITPCPPGWRLPTHDEWVALGNTGTTWAEANTRGNAVAGRFFGPNHATCTMDNMAGCIFLPAVGDRSSLGTNSQGIYALYWFSPVEDEAYYRNWSWSNAEGIIISLMPCEDGLSIRCVR